jgi:NitT/TauT family transport system permease protein
VAIAVNRYRLQRVALVSGQLVALLLFLTLWQLASDKKIIDPYFFSKPSQIWSTIASWESGGTLARDVGATLLVLGLGYVCGLAAGLVLGVCMGASKWFGELVEPFVAFFNAIPRLILLPLFLVLFGFGFFPQILLVVVVIVFMVAINIAQGIREVDYRLVEHVRVIGGKRRSILTLVYLPSISVWIGSTARVTVGYAFQAAVISEFAGRAEGLGYLVVYGQTTIKVQVIYAAIAIMVVVAFVLDILLGALERRATRWMPRGASFG